MLPRDADPVRAGRLLFFVSGLVAGVAEIAMDPSTSGWWTLLAVSTAMLALYGLSFVVPWQRLPRRSAVFFPVMVCAALITLASRQPMLAAPLTGLVSLGFAYLGLTQAPGTGVMLLPFASLALIAANGGWSAQSGVRLFIAVSVWMLLAELPSRQRRQQLLLAEALRVAAHTDALTSIPNRRDLELRLATLSAGDTVVVCDLDHFKQLNDSQGHHAGDRVLGEFGITMRASLREGDYCARYGGEEFVIVLQGTSVAAARQVVARLRQHWKLLEPAITFSAGIAHCSPGQDHTRAFGEADAALYAAKAAGRNRDCVSESSLAPR